MQCLKRWVVHVSEDKKIDLAFLKEKSWRIKVGFVAVVKILTKWGSRSGNSETNVELAWISNSGISIRLVSILAGSIIGGSFCTLCASEMISTGVTWPDWLEDEFSPEVLTNGVPCWPSNLWIGLRLRICLTTNTTARTPRTTNAVVIKRTLSHWRCASAGPIGVKGGSGSFVQTYFEQNPGVGTWVTWQKSVSQNRWHSEWVDFVKVQHPVGP